MQCKPISHNTNDLKIMPQVVITITVLQLKSQFDFLFITLFCLCCCLPTPLLVGESDLPACGPPASSAIILAGSVHRSMGDNVVRMRVQLKTCVCECYKGVYW